MKSMIVDVVDARRFAKLLLFIFTFLLTTGCAAQRAARPVVTPDSPVLYSPYTGPLPLTSAERAEIARLAEPLRPQDTFLWFIVLHRNEPRDGRMNYRVTLYFAPSDASARLRKGLCLDLDNDDSFPGHPNPLDLLGPRPPRALVPYVQVSRDNSRTLSELPALGDLPFSPPKGLPDAELVAVVDFLRSFGTRPLLESKMRRTADGFSFELASLPNQLEPNAPILDVSTEGDEIHIHTGWVAAPLVGHGIDVVLRRTPAGFEVVSLFSWYA